MASGCAGFTHSSQQPRAWGLPDGCTGRALRQSSAAAQPGDWWLLTCPHPHLAPRRKLVEQCVTSPEEYMEVRVQAAPSCAR